MRAVRLGVVHDRTDLERHATSGNAVVICGHPHVPRVGRVNGVLVVHRGSAARDASGGGDRERVRIDGSSLDVCIGTLDVAPPPARR